MVALAQVKVVGIRLSRVLIARSLEGIEALRVRHVQRAQDESVHDAEDDGIGPDGHGQRQNGGDGEPWRLAQLAKDKSQVLQQGGHGRPLGDNKATWKKGNSRAK